MPIRLLPKLFLEGFLNLHKRSMYREPTPGAKRAKEEERAGGNSPPLLFKPRVDGVGVRRWAAYINGLHGLNYLPDDRLQRGHSDDGACGGVHRLQRPMLPAGMSLKRGNPSPVSNASGGGAIRSDAIVAAWVERSGPMCGSSSELESLMVSKVDLPLCGHMDVKWQCTVQGCNLEAEGRTQGPTKTIR
ncbi:uncharacterized protein LAESUDRAFT_716038 [Laetiporus sulphureus 93-53]|uniref:Uncharacterized protein n=1 Tax=Laetiporus sulphureus 93-53 TaxID=1314785 RepID=A0A165CXB6_9APHY|nr:uncharacterized protein LAESUDRAFT_716038 [Laetiporus sulphureus 93-53]KZT03652.1 hypothetical protein LAESUDRAFT_716038 [Laetiporus sulphureus 93-53]